METEDYRAAIGDLVMAIFSACIVFGGVVPYYFQYREIVKNQNARGFSLYVCLALLVANILRVLFWFGKQFEIQLLLQSIIMIACMLVMIDVSVRVTSKQDHLSHKIQTIWDGQLFRSFWQWSDLSSYLVVTVWFSAVMLSVTYVLLDNDIFVDILGFLALFTEALLGAPQFLANFRRKSTFGMSVKMVIMWTTGDVFKTVYFLLKNTPAQFWLCGILQVTVDLLILSQVLWYRPKPH